MPKNVGSKEDLISKNIPSRHIEICNADLNFARHKHDSDRTQNINPNHNL